jgi:hypothetical protein
MLSRKRLAMAGACLTLLALAVPGAASAHDEAGHTGTTGDLRDLVADLYGGNGITFDPTINSGHAGHFTAASANALNNLSQVVAANTGSFSFNSTVSAVSFDIDQGVAVRTAESLGPILGERASTIGAGRINFAISASDVRYKQLDGTKLNRLSLVLTHEDVPGVFNYEADTILLDLHLKLEQAVVAFYGTYGLTDNLDVGVIVPVVYVDGSVSSHATVNYTGSGPLLGPTIHRFGGLTSPDSSNHETAAGLGDITVRAKWHVTKGLGLPVEAALVGQATFATGAEQDLLGTGSNAAYLGGVVSGRFGRLSPHLNVGYEHYFDDNSLFEHSNARVVAGFDVKASDHFAVSADFLGRWEENDRKRLDLAIGAKWEAFKNAPLSVNVILPLNREEGLRPDYILSLGIESTF